MNNQTNRISRVESILQALIDVDKNSATAKSLAEYMTFVYQLLTTLMPIRACYFSLYNQLEQSINVKCNMDQFVQSIHGTTPVILASPERSPTAWVILNKKILSITKANNTFDLQEGNHWDFGTKTEHWLGMPLISHQGNCLAALVIQSYHVNERYSEEDVHIFKLFSSIIASVIEKHVNVRPFENTIVDRTNILEKELSERIKSEKLQNALFEISSLKNGDIELGQLFESIHHIIDKLLYAHNFCILLLDDELSELTIAYFVDEIDGNNQTGKVIPLGHGLSSYVIKSKLPQRLSPQLVQKLILKGDIYNVEGSPGYTSWIGAPMISDNILHGIIVVQSYDENIIFTDEDLNILNFFATDVATAIEATINAQQRRESQIKLALHLRLLEQQNTQLKDAYKTLKSTQQELIQKEKMASLGGLVAGIAHEINTPLGICVTGVSHLLEESRLFRESVNDKKLTESQLFDFMEEIDEVCKILTTNTQRAAALIQSFKQIAVDQSSNEIRNVNIKNYLDEIILSLRPMLKRTKHIINISCDNNLWINTHAGAISQVISNLIINSVKHAFDNIEKGIMAIDVTEQRESILLTFCDNGSGLDEKNMTQLFDPFFTTKRGEGGSGLGTHLIYNLVTSSLKGKLKASSELGQGLTYTIKFPKNMTS